MKCIGHKYIQKTRAYCDYLEEHLNNIALAFDEVYSKCKHLPFFANDFNYHTLYHQVESHDISKFSSEEFTQYRTKFFPTTEELSYVKGFDKAWKHHYTNNPHHWESASTEIDVVHMVIDWTAMSYKFGGNAQSYYEANQNKIKLKPDLVPFMYSIFNALKDNV